VNWGLDKILVVDDEPSIRGLAQMILEDEGYHVITAGNGVETIEKVRNEKPDLVLLDVMMPGMNGFEVCRRLKDQASNEDPIRVVMFTVLKSDLDRRVAEESGCDGYLVKPFAPEDLIGEVAKYLRKST